MFLKNPIKRQKGAILFKTCKIMGFEILTFDFNIQGKRLLLTTVYMNESTS